jgi:hypothetical protein
VKLKHAKLIVQAAADLGLDMTLAKSYSGRGMMGKTTTGIVGSLPDIIRSIADVAYNLGLDDVSGESYLADVGHLSIDEMGRQHIVY